MSAPPPAGSAMASSAAKSTGAWLNDLKDLFDHAKERFPDVVWEMLPEEAGSADEEVWGHKAMIYARAPPSFLAQYFDVRPNGASRIYSASPGQDLGPNPTQSTFSLAIGEEQPTASRTPSPSRAHLYSPSSSHPTNTLLRLTTAISPSLFSNQLEYIYTGKGIGAAFEFLFDSPEGIDGAVDVDATRIDKLRKDLVFMWRSRLYSDVKIALTGPFSPDSEEATAVFSSHRFVLASRSPYFRALFLSGFASVTPSSSSPITITLPSPPFTPASLHFTLGYIYAGTLNFSHRTFDLTTAFQIYRSAAYLSLTSLQSEIESRIVEEMTHGLFHAYLTFEEYEKVTGGRWGVGGSKCKQCTRRIPRILEFATSEDIKNTILDRGARRALVGLFGEGWVTPEFAALPAKSRATALKGVYARTTPQNLFPLLFAAESALAKVESPGTRDQPWADMLKELIVQARKKMDDVLCSQCEDVFEQEEWLAILENDGLRFDDGDKVRWVMDSLRRGLGDTNAGIVYQTLVSSVLLRPHPTSASVHAATLLSSTSPIRSQVERARLDILRWLRKRWIGVRLANGFNSLDGWALKEISDELDVPVDDLLAPPPSKGALTPHSSIESASSPRPNQDADTASIASSRANAPPNRSVPQTTVQSSAEAQRDPLASSRSSVASSVSVSSIRTASTAQARARQSNATSSPVPRNTPPRPRVENTSPRPANSSLTPPNGRPKSLAPSIASVRSVSSARSVTSITSTTSTIGKERVSSAPRTPTNLSAPSPLSRPHSRVSNSSDASTTFNTAPSTVSLRGRTTSAMSNASNSSARGGGSRSQGLTVPIEVRPRRTSATSTTSVASSTLGSSNAAPPLPRKVDVMIQKSKAAPRPSSTASARSAGSGTPERRKVPIATRTPLKQQAQPPPPSPVKIPVIDRSTKPAKSSGSLRESPIPDGAQRRSVTSLHTPHPSDASTIRATPDLERKPSSDTITKPGSAHSGTSTGSGYVTPRASVAMSAQSYQTPSPTTSPPPVPPIQMQVMAPLQARGVTLNIGIPCMISSNRSRFKAFARYIGEVEGEMGPWVGVEVPVGDGWSADKLDGRDWNDGSLRGVRYFDIGGSIDDGEERAARRQRLDLVPDSASSISSINGYQSSLNRRKREGDLLHVEQERMKRLRSTSPAISDISNMESRGLFVRPQQILLVIDAQEQH